HGVRTLIHSQHNAWIHAAATAATLTASFVLGLSRLEWCVIVAAIMAVWTAEALNTAFEALCDVASPAMHPAVERAKDVAAGGVLITAMGAAVIGVLVFGPHIGGRFAERHDRAEGSCRHQEKLPSHTQSKREIPFNTGPAVRSDQDLRR